MSRIAVAGSINTDFVVRTARFPQPGETVIGESFAVYGGGKGANQAIAAARLGASVEFFGAVGEDANSAERLTALRTDTVGTHHVAQVQGYGGIAIIQVESASGQNSITLIPGANAGVTAEQVVPALTAWCSPGDIIAQQLEIPLDTVHSVLSVGRKCQATNVLNGAPFDARLSDMLELVDDLIVNEIEAGQLLGTGPVSVERASQATKQIRRLGVRKSVIITLGSQGAWLSESNFDGLIPAREVLAVDTTGAGDAFCGAFCAWVARGKSRVDAVRIATLAGSIAVQRHGAQPSLPYLKELERESAKD